MQKSRMYFAALVLSDQIFEKMPLGNAKHAVPYISHWQGDAYYRGLLQIKDGEKLGQLLDLSEQAKTTDEINVEIKQMLQDADKADIVELPGSRNSEEIHRNLTPKNFKNLLGTYLPNSEELPRNLAYLRLATPSHHGS